MFLLVWKAKFTLINEDLSESTDTAVHSWLLMCDLNYRWCESVDEVNGLLKGKTVSPGWWVVPGWVMVG